MRDRPDGWEFLFFAMIVVGLVATALRAYMFDL